MSAMVLRSGVPVAWVINATMKAKAPSHVTVESDGGVLTVRGVAGKMFFVAMADTRSATFGNAVEDALAKAKGLLGEA